MNSALPALIVSLALPLATTVHALGDATAKQAEVKPADVKPADTKAADAKPADAKAPKLAAVERGDLTLVVERPGRVEPVRKTPLRFELEAFGGPVSVKDVVRRSGPVKQGDMIALLEGKEFDKALEDVRTQVAETRQRVAMQKEERAMQARQAAAGVERAELGAALADQALQLHQEYESGKALEFADLNLKGTMDGLRDNKDELSQLEKMYSGTTLQSETKDIVLDRARRQVDRGETYAKYAKRDNEIFKAIRHPNEARRVADSAKYSKLDLEGATLGQRLGEIRAALDIAAAERGLRDAERKLAKMEEDGKRMTVKATGDGYLVVQVKDPGDLVQPRQTVAEIVDLGALRVRGTMSAEALRIAKPGDVMQVWFPVRPEARAEAVIEELVAVGAPEGEGAAFPFTALLRNIDGQIYPGIEARLVARSTLPDRILVPAKAVKNEKGRFVAKVLIDGKEIEREVRIGASDGTRTEVLSGLQAGDQVVVPDA